MGESNQSTAHAPLDGIAERTATKRRRALYLSGVGAVLLLNLITSAIPNAIVSDLVVMASILLIGVVFHRLFTAFHCHHTVQRLLFLAVAAMALAQVLSITEEIEALRQVPVLGSTSGWNGFLDTLGMVTGLVLILSSLVLAAIELGEARDTLSEEVAVRARAEAALEKHRHHLEDEIRSRTAALEHAQDELLVRERLAALGEIMSAVSHELRNPLGVIRSSLFSLERAIEKEDLRPATRVLARCDRSITRCDHIIEELHDFSQAQEVNQQVLPLDEWLADLVGRTAMPEAVSCETNLKAGVSVPLDPERMGRALRHLIDNSLDAFEDTKDREKRLMVTSLIDASRCRIQIQDTGTGMTADELAHVGEPLFSTRSFGAGLGVPIAKETIRRHGGTVHYESDPDKGTTVTIELPLAAVGSESRIA